MFDMFMNMTVDGKQGGEGVNVIIHGLGGLQLKITNAIARDVEHVMRQGMADIIANFPKKTGATASHIVFEQPGPMVMSVVVVGKPWTNIYQWIDYGTKGHGPKHAKALHWVDDAGNDVFARYVRGIPARYITKRAFERMSSEIDQICALAVRK